MTSAIQSALGAELAARVSPATIIRYHEPLGRRTTLRVGGPADVYAEPASEADLSAILRTCRERKSPWFVLGRGSNLLVTDHGYRGVVICLAHPVFSRISLTGLKLECGAGAKLRQVAQEAKKHSVTGLEFLEGIPGSVGGALRMNAGAMGGAIFDAVDSVRTMDSEGNLSQYVPSEMAVSYRRCGLLHDHIALAAVLRCSFGNPAEIEARMRQYSQKRWSSQPAAPSAGCMFKNPPGTSAGRIIDELGLKGTRVGGALVSLEHGNFIVNDGGATAADVVALLRLVSERVQAERGICLEPEVQILGD